MRIDVVSILPEMFDAVAAHGIPGRAVERGLVTLERWNPRDFTEDAYRRVDDRTFGGGPGMVMMAEPLSRALDAVERAQRDDPRCGARGPVVYLSPQGAKPTQARIREMAGWPALTLLCGRYEGVDQRLLDARVDEQVSIGDFVLSGGELPAMVLIDAVVRWLPGAMNDAASAAEDSFGDHGLLDCPHWTRPEVWNGQPVPEVLRSGHHAKIQRWRRDRALEATLRSRPDLIEAARAAGRLDKADEKFLAQLVRAALGR